MAQRREWVDTPLGLFEWVELLPSITLKSESTGKYVRRNRIILKSPPVEASYSYNRLKLALSNRELWKIETVATFIGTNAVSPHTPSSLSSSSSSSSVSSSAPSPSSLYSPSRPLSSSAAGEKRPPNFTTSRETSERLLCRIRAAGRDVLWWSVQPLAQDPKKKNAPEGTNVVLMVPEMSKATIFELVRVNNDSMGIYCPELSSWMTINSGSVTTAPALSLMFLPSSQSSGETFEIGTKLCIGWNPTGDPSSIRWFKTQGSKPPTANSLLPLMMETLLVTFRSFGFVISLENYLGKFLGLRSSGHLEFLSSPEPAALFRLFPTFVADSSFDDKKIDKWLIVHDLTNKVVSVATDSSIHASTEDRAMALERNHVFQLTCVPLIINLAPPSSQLVLDTATVNMPVAAPEPFVQIIKIFGVPLNVLMDEQRSKLTPLPPLPSSSSSSSSAPLAASGSLPPPPPPRKNPPSLQSLSSMFGTSATLSTKQTLIPTLVFDALEFLRPQVETEGLFRVSGSLPKMNLLRGALESGLRIPDAIEKCATVHDCIVSCHEVSGVLKAFFRELPEPLIPYSCYQAFMTPLSLEEGEVRVNAFKAAVEALPADNFNLLKKLMEFLHLTIQYQEQNRMSPQNLAIVFAHTLLRESPEAFDFANPSVPSFLCLVNDFPAIFA